MDHSPARIKQFMVSVRQHLKVSKETEEIVTTKTYVITLILQSKIRPRGNWRPQPNGGKAESPRTDEDLNG